MQAPVPLLNVLTVPPGVTAAQQRVVIDGLRGAILVYTGSPGWSFTVSGSPVTDSYFVLTQAQAASVKTGNLFTASTQPGTLFTVTAVSSPFAGYVNVSFTPAASSPLAAPAVVTQESVLSGSWASQAGTDPYGNSYPAGLDVSGGSGVITGPDYIFNNAGLFIYNGTPAARNLIASVTAAGGTDQFGNSYLAGVSSYGTGTAAGLISQVITGGVSVTNLANAEGLGGPAATTPAGLSIAAPSGSNSSGAMIVQSPSYATSPPAQQAVLLLSGRSQDGTIPSYAQFLSSGGVPLPVVMDFAIFTPQGAQPPEPSLFGGYPYLYSDPAAGSLDYVNSSGQPGHIPLTVTDSSQNTVTQSFFTNITALPRGIPANDVTQGTVYRVSCGGNGVQGSTQQALSMQLLAGSTALGFTTMGTNTIPANDSFHWNYTGYIMVVSPSPGTVRCWGVFEFSVAAPGGTSGTAAFDTSSAAVSFGVANPVQVQMRWSSTTGGPSITCNGAVLERLGVLS